MIHGLTYPWKAFNLIRQTPKLWGYILFPLGITAGLAFLLYGGVFLYSWRWLNMLNTLALAPLLNSIDRLPSWLSGLGLLAQGFVFLIQILLGLVLCWILGLVLTQLSVLLGSPWYGRLSEVLEKERIPDQFKCLPPSSGIVEDLSRALQFELKKLGLTLLVLLLIFACQFVPIAGQLGGTALGLLWGSLLACLDFWDGPLERRRLRFRQKFFWMLRQFPANLSFGLLCSTLVSIPVLNLLTIPLCVAAGTLLVSDRLAQSVEKATDDAP